MRFSEKDHLHVGDNEIVSPMFTVWESNQAHVRKYPSSAIFWSLVSRYKINNVVYGGEDGLCHLEGSKPDKNEYNILSINATAGNHNFCSGGGADLVISGKQEISDDWYKNISYAIDNGIKVFIDYSWEQVPQWKIQNEDFVDYCLNNNIKLLTNSYDIRPALDPKSILHGIIDRKFKKENVIKFLEENVVNTKEVHEFFTRVSVNNKINLSWNLARCPVDWKDKKYMFSSMIGECRKLKNCLFIYVSKCTSPILSIPSLKIFSFTNIGRLNKYFPLFKFKIIS